MTAFPLVTSRQLAEAATGPDIVLVDFWQASCAPYRALEPRLEQFSSRHPGEFTGYRIDVDTEHERSVPIR
jgi:thioredoxin 1